MNFELDDINNLAKVLNDNDLSEITVKNTSDGRNQSITLKKSIANENVSCLEGQVIQVPAQNLNNVEYNDNTKKQEETVRGVPITSPMVGTFYAAPSPKLPAFVNEGDSISKGQVICIIEAMKLMNEIESDIAGRVTKICVKNGDAVEFGQVLMYVE